MRNVSLNGVLLVSALTCQGLQARGAVTNYDWPNSVSRSDKYNVRVREAPDGVWQDVHTHDCVPRTKPNRDIGEGTGVTAFMNDRTLSFVQLAFTGGVEIEVTKTYGAPAPRVEICPKGYGLNPHFFDGKTVRFMMSRWGYVSVNFVCDDNQDNDRFGGKNIKHGVMVFADEPESVSYTRPRPGDPGVVVWDNDVDVETIRNADIIYFPPGDHDMKGHKDNRSAFDIDTFEEAVLYRGQLRLKKPTKVYVAGGAYVRGCFNAKGEDKCWLYGRGIVSGRNHRFHEILVPRFDDKGKPIIKTQTKEAFCDYRGSDDAYFGGVVIMEAFHHTIPSGKRTKIEHIKILGWCSNNDGIRPGDDSEVDGIFIKTSDDYDYARSPHTVRNSVFWPMVNGAVGMLGWNDLGTGHARYLDNHIINCEWSSVDKRNTGVIGSVAKDGIELVDNYLENIHIEGRTSFLVNTTVTPRDAIDKPGHLRDFVFRNIKVERPFHLPNGKQCKQRMAGFRSGGKTCWVEGFTFTNLVVDGKLVTWDNYQDHFDLILTGVNSKNEDRAKCVRNVTFNSEGAIRRIEATVGLGGVIHPRGADGVIDCPEGTSQSIAIVPDEGYRIKAVKVDGESVGRIQTLAFNNVDADHTVDVVFEKGVDYFDLK